MKKLSGFAKLVLRIWYALVMILRLGGVTCSFAVAVKDLAFFPYQLVGVVLESTGKCPKATLSIYQRHGGAFGKRLETRLSYESTTRSHWSISANQISTTSLILQEQIHHCQ